MDALPGKTDDDGFWILSKKDYNRYLSYKEKQRQIAQKVLEEVLKKNPQWKDKVKECECKE